MTLDSSLFGTTLTLTQILNDCLHVRHVGTRSFVHLFVLEKFYMFDKKFSSLKHATLLVFMLE